MRNIPAPLLAHLAGNVLTLALCVKITRPDGSVLGLTTFDRDLTLGGVTYEVVDGVNTTSLRATQGTGIDNMEIEGLLSSSRISDADLLAGRYDNALFEFFVVNWAEVPLTNRAVISSGTVGQIVFSEGKYHVELRSQTQHLSQNIIEMISPSCRVRLLGDSRCKLAVPIVAISGITNAAAAVVTTPSAHGLVAGQGVLFTLVGGMTAINGLLGTVLNVPSPTTLTVNINSSGFGAYTSGGQIGFQWAHTVSTVPSLYQLTFAETINGSGYYNYGRIIMTSGANIGFSKEIKSQTTAGGIATVTLQEPFPFAVLPGDGLLAEAGCDRSIGICISRFNNAVNHRAEPHVPGNDVIQARGRR